jgi:ribonucleoside-diphosphate reductase alpha chain
VVHARNACAVERRHRTRPAHLCYLNSVDDSLEGIVNTWNENVWLASRGGGIGTYWGSVRGIGEPVGLNGKTSGIIPFVRVMDSLTLAISQGSLRRGSAACYLDVSHPEIEEFLEIRKPSGDFNRKALNLHHGVLLSDEFMEAVRNGEEFNLRSPKDGSIRATVDARSLFQKLVETRLATGEPYIIFSDTVNRSMPKHHQRAGAERSRPPTCAPKSLCPPVATIWVVIAPRCAACRRSTLRHGTSGAPTRPSSKISCACSTMCCRISSTAPPTKWRAPNIARRANARSGWVSWASTASCSRAASALNRAMAKSWNMKIFKHIRAQADQASMVLASERGACPDAEERGVMERFSCKMAIAPTASISIICGGTSACIEPIPANIYTHKTLSGSFIVKNPYLEKLLQDKAKDSTNMWNSILEKNGSVQHLDFLSAGGKGHVQDQLRDRPALAARTRRRPHALYRSGTVAEPVHSG